MKKTILIPVLILMVSFVFGQVNIPISFDERADLMSLIFRTAGANEYGICYFDEYVNNLKPYINETDEVVKLAQKYREETGISYDAVADFAFHLKISENGKLTLDGAFQDGIDERWTEEQKQNFLTALNEYYAQSNFHQGYMKNAEIQKKAENAFERDVCQRVDLEWFDKFFGANNNPQFRIILSILNGPNNYGCNAQMKDGSFLLSPFIGCCSVDSLGEPVYRANAVLPIVIHEFCHAYCNPQIERFWTDMKVKADEVYYANALTLTQMAYGNAKTMMYETFVRSCVIRYFLNHYPQVSVDDLLAEDADFYLTRTMVESLGKYEQNREQYPTIESYMPQLINDINQFNLKNFMKEQKKDLKANAHVVKCSIKNGAKNVPSGKIEMKITFSKPMMNMIALGNGASDGKSLDIDRQRESIFTWSKDCKTTTVYLDLQPNTHYAFSILGGYYRTQDGHTAGANIFYDFWTK
ncbi:MAG: DUF4932 domain-containing protein [Bacteroidales bacterium]|nr:DUF4932 domain-containing protein [Bacteroidales bacterium]